MTRWRFVADIEMKADSREEALFLLQQHLQALEFREKSRLKKTGKMKFYRSQKGNPCASQLRSTDREA